VCCRQRRQAATDSSVEKRLEVEHVSRRRWLGRSATGVTGGVIPSGGVNGKKATAAVMRYGYWRGKLFVGYEPRREGSGRVSRSRTVTSVVGRHVEAPRKKRG